MAHRNFGGLFFRSKKMKNVILSLVFLILTTTLSFAKNSADIFTGSSSANLLFTKAQYEDYKASFVGTIGYDHVFSQGIQLGTVGAAVIGDGYKSITILVGPGYNLNANDLENSFYMSFMMGVDRISYGSYTHSDFVVQADGGKRFKIANGITYSPGVTISKVTGPNSDDPAISINIFKFSLLF